ncbi:hypothetical protein OROHE_022327 [Orobanche hederae]
MTGHQNETSAKVLSCENGRKIRFAFLIPGLAYRPSTS